MSFHEKVKRIREEKHLTQRAVASKLGIHYTSMNKYEQGLAVPSINIAKGIAKVLGVSIDYLVFDGEDEIAKSKILDNELLKQFEEASKLDNEDKEMIKTVIESIITKKQIEKMIMKNSLRKAS